MSGREASAQARGRRTRRIVHFTGPGDIIGTFERWTNGEDDPREVSMTYSGQFYDLCERLDARALVISCNAQRRELREGRFRIMHRPILWDRAGGVRFHLGRLWHGLKMIGWTLRFRADVAVIAMGTHWFVLAALRLLGVKIVPTLHNTLWLRRADDTPPGGLISRLDRCFFRRCCTAIMVASYDIGRQVDQLTGGRHAPLVEFLPTYRADTFAGVAPIDAEANPFRVLYLGRIERAKGVFDLLRVCRELRDAGLDVRFDLCGAGSALEELRREASTAGVADVFVCHGHCRQQEVRGHLGACHVLVAPTRSSFSEGFAMTVVEGVLAGRPVITSSICPAMRYVKAAVIEVAPDAVDEYRDAIARLYRSRTELSAFGRQTREAAAMFYNEANGWGRTLEYVLTCVTRGERIDGLSRLPQQPTGPTDEIKFALTTSDKGPEHGD